jgi:hypothetical protein
VSLCHAAKSLIAAGTVATPSECQSLASMIGYYDPNLKVENRSSGADDDGQPGSWQLFAFFRSVQPMRSQTRFATRSSADRSRFSPYGGVLLTCQGKFPINKLQKSSQLAILLLKMLDPEPQCSHNILPRRELSIP